ncbi:MAG TPA: glycosyltransferase [Gaiellaceae bacterium]|nr:glycosyltransferase [Gaiellaceae bacterium]
MRVLHATKVQGIGGAEQHLLALLPALRERGVDVRFLSLDGGLDAERFHGALSDRDVPYVRVPIGGDASPRVARDVVRAVRREHPDLLHTHMVHADVYGSIAAHALRVPFLSTRHNDDRYLLGPFRHVDRAFMHGVRRIVAISDAVRDFHIRAGLPPDRLVTIHYGLDEAPTAASEVTPADAGVPDGAPLVLAIGRLIEQKDHATLLRAFARVEQAHLAILGWGPLEERTKALAAELGLSERVHVTGRVEPRDWLARADVFVHTSRWEGFGIVLLEAMLNRLPVVATRVSAIPEIVVDGETGLLAAAGDDATIAAHLSALLGDAPRREALGEAGWSRALSEFSVARMADRTLDVYRAALA